MPINRPIPKTVKLDSEIKDGLEHLDQKTIYIVYIRHYRESDFKLQPYNQLEVLINY